MSRILVIHGTGGPSRTEDSLRLEWVTSMQDGLALAGHDPFDLDITLVNLDLHLSGQRTAGPQEGEAGIAHRWWQAARFEGERPVPSDVGDAGALLGVLDRSRFFAGIPSDELLVTVRVLGSFLAQDALGRRATGQVTAALAPDVEIVIGHGLGAVAAVHALSGGTAHRVPTLVTVGMPFGTRAATPPAVARWVNVIDGGDALASGEGLEYHRGTHVRDVWLDCDPRLRAPRNYLASPEFGAVLAAALLPAA